MALIPADRVHARVADRMLMTALQQPTYLQNYLKKRNLAIINIAFDLVSEIPQNPLPRRIQLLAELLSRNPIIEAEFPLLYHLCFCKLNFNGLPESQKSKIHALQNTTFQHLSTRMSDANRFQQLTTLSHEFVQTFYANL